LNKLTDRLEDHYPNQVILGIDEAGRGPLAGPCIVCGVILPLGYTHPLIYDSKALSPKQRNLCFNDILRDALWIHIVAINPSMIDSLNIYQATKRANAMIIEQSQADCALTDAMPIQQAKIPVYDFIKGDQRSITIAAASIIAKVTRDAIMETYDTLYPEYGFKQHKGYPTKQHRDALTKYGITPIHRLSYEPVRLINQMSLYK
jgi:ribonuclease HII